MKLPIVCVVIVNYNGKHLLETCLDSIYKQTYKNYEVILVDNGSADGSVEFIEKNYPSVKLIKNKKNLGYAKSNNMGIDISKGKYIITLNNDTRVKPDWIENLVEVAEKDDKIGICASKQLNFYQPDLIDSTGINLHKGAYPSNRGHGEKDKGQFNEQVEVFAAPGASAFYRKEMLDRIGFFDEDYFAFQEEFDLCWRARLYGWKCVYAPKAIVYHIGGATVGARTKFLHYQMERNRLLTIVKDYPFVSLLLYLPYILKYEFDVCLRILAAYEFELLRARFSAIKLLFKSLKKRRIIQKNRVISEREFRKWISKS